LILLALAEVAGVWYLLSGRHIAVGEGTTMSLAAQDIIDVVRRQGARWAVISIFSTIGLGVVDHFTSKIIPSIAASIENVFNPPKFFVTFLPPVDLTGGFTISPLEGNTAKKIDFKVSDPAARVFTVMAGYGTTYELRLRGVADKDGRELVALTRIEQSGAIWTVDTSDRYWANSAAIRSGADAPAVTSQPPATQSGASSLSGTRWSVAALDSAVMASIPDMALRSTMAAALAEVGVFEFGSAREKRRIVEYWAAAGPEWASQIKDKHIPWGGAFMAWVVKQAGVAPPPGPASFTNWLGWEKEVKLDAIAPGMIAIFHLDNASDVRQAPSRLLVGVVLRQQADCVEIILGNISNRVVITCVAKPLLIGVRRPQE
jgi:hypothetical protein